MGSGLESEFIELSTQESLTLQESAEVLGNIHTRAGAASGRSEGFLHVSLSWKWDCVQIYFGVSKSGCTLVSGGLSISVQEFGNMCSFMYLCVKLCGF